MTSEYYLLFYEVVEDYVTRRAPYRKEHVTLAQDYVNKGFLVLGGALDQPADAAVLVFYVHHPAVIEEFVKADPYFRAGLVSGWKIRKYKAVVGTACENPINPATL